MRAPQVVASVLVVVVAGVVVAAPVVGVGLPATPQPQTDESPGGGFGQQISSFAQATAADANASTDSGMWQAAVNGSENPADEVRGRVATLERRLDRLENRTAALTAQRENGTISEVAYTARASALRVRMANLREAIAEADRTARRVGVNATRLDRLRSQAANMSGPDVAALARTITDAPRGPPEDRPGAGGPPGDRPGEGGPPGDAGAGEDGTGPPADGGPPGDAGEGQNGTAGNSGSGQSGDAGPDGGGGDGGASDEDKKNGDGNEGNENSGDGGDGAGDGGSGAGDGGAGGNGGDGDGGDGGSGAGDGGDGGGDSGGGPPGGN